MTRQPWTHIADSFAISVKDISDGHVRSDALERLSLSSPTKASRYLAEPGDILVACRGTVPKVALVPPNLAGALLTSTLIGIRMNGRLLPEVLYLYLQSPDGQKALLSRARSSTQQIALTPRDVAQLEVPLPAMDIQQRIAELVRLAEQHYGAAEAAARLRREVAHDVALKLMKSDRSTDESNTQRHRE